MPLETLTPLNGTSEKYTGRWDKQHDQTSMLIEMGVRPYDPALGRFLAVDPVEGGSANLYDYVIQDPIRLYDLEGTVAGLGLSPCSGNRHMRANMKYCTPSVIDINVVFSVPKVGGFNLGIQLGGRGQNRIYLGKVTGWGAGGAITLTTPHPTGCFLQTIGSASGPYGITVAGSAEKSLKRQGGARSSGLTGGYGVGARTGLWAGVTCYNKW